MKILVEKRNKKTNVLKIGRVLAWSFFIFVHPSYDGWLNARSFKAIKQYCYYFIT